MEGPITGIHLGPALLISCVDSRESCTIYRFDSVDLLVSNLISMFDVDIGVSDFVFW